MVFLYTLDMLYYPYNLMRFFKPLHATYKNRQLLILAILSFILILSACQEEQKNSITPIIEPLTVAYVKRPVPTGNSANRFMDLRNNLAFSAGGDLYIRDLSTPNNPEKNITASLTLGQGDVKDIDTSADGDKLIFALCAIQPCNPIRDPQSTETWSIWEYVFSTGVLRRIMTDNITAHAGEDTSPHYLPDGRIIFLSTRQKQAKARLLDEGKPQFSAVDENRREPATVLHIMNNDGTNIRQLSFNQSHDLSPTVLKNGLILFSRWDHMGSRNQISLYSIRPDGSELKRVYGSHSHNDTNNTVAPQFIDTHELPDGRLLALLKPFTGTQLGGELVFIDSENFSDISQIRTTSTQSSPSSTQTAATPLITTSSSPSPDGRFLNAVPLWDGSHRALVSWSPCRLLNGSRILPCSAMPNNNTLPEADPLYSLYIYDFDNNTQLPVFPAEEGVMIDDIAVAFPRPFPDTLIDKDINSGLKQSLIGNNTGSLHIQSVYDFDGTFSPLGATATSIAELADPAQTTANQRPARFLRIVKAVAIPDRNTRRIAGTAFGRSRQQLMREIIGYTPIEPDGSVITQVPANVPFAVTIVDNNGKRIGNRHENWLQVRAGEVIECTGCHDHTNNSAHGTATPAVALNSGAATSGIPFPNTDPARQANMGETMAQTQARLTITYPLPSNDLVYQDLWTDPASAGRPKDINTQLTYADLMTLSPATANCQPTWTATCRALINYIDHIQPLWELNRLINGVDNTCIACHSTRDAMNVLRVPLGQLDLTNGPSPDQADHIISYRELLFNDNEQTLLNGQGVLQDKLVPATDTNGNPIFQTDANGNPVLDAQGNPIPLMVTVNIPPTMRPSGAASSNAFFDLFETGTHVGRLSPAELRLIAEWLDIGAQYYNNPFDAPVQ